MPWNYITLVGFEGSYHIDMLLLLFEFLLAEKNLFTKELFHLIAKRKPSKEKAWEKRLYYLYLLFNFLMKSLWGRRWVSADSSSQRGSPRYSGYLSNITFFGRDTFRRGTFRRSLSLPRSSCAGWCTSMEKLGDESVLLNFRVFVFIRNLVVKNPSRNVSREFNILNFL